MPEEELNNEQLGKRIEECLEELEGAEREGNEVDLTHRATVNAFKKHGRLLYYLSEKENRSTKRLERLTSWLIGLTVVLTFLTVILVVSTL